VKIEIINFMIFFI